MRNIRARLTIALTLGIASTGHAADIVAPSGVPLTQTVVMLDAGVDATLGSSNSRRYLCLLNVGTDLVTLGFDRPASIGSGWALDAAASLGHQGGSMCWESAVVVAGAVHAISAAGSTVVVLEGR
jgi:hypothetical protein